MLPVILLMHMLDSSRSESHLGSIELPSEEISEVFPDMVLWALSLPLRPLGPESSSWLASSHPQLADQLASSLTPA